MHLYASGFNAFNQLVFPPAQPQQDPKDLRRFTKILQRDHISVRAGLNHTTVAFSQPGQSGEIQRAGCYDDRLNGEAVTSEFRVETSAGRILVITHEKDGGLTSYPSLEAFQTGRHDGSWEGHVKQLLAHDVGFVVLYKDGRVATMGDPRFESCLGRPIDEAHPANEPCVVTDLLDLGPVVKVAARGYTAAALTQSGDLYVWGTPTTGVDRQPQAFPDLEGIPNYSEVDGEKEVKDVAVGGTHALALTVDGCVYGIGGDDNGQLGGAGRLDSWTELGFRPPEGHVITEVAAGHRSSFIITGPRP